MPDRRELMAIGDSIYNGARSLTINAELAQLSVPVQVARAFDWKFKAPANPFDVLFNLKALFCANAFNLDTLKATVIVNAQRWLDRTPWAHDNIPIAQTTIADQAHVSQIRPLLARVRTARGIDFGALTTVPALLDLDNLLIDLVVAMVKLGNRPSV